MATVELNGVDLSTYGFTAQIADDLLSSPARSYDAVKQPDRPGARVGLRTIASKPFTVAGMLESTSLAAARSNLDLLMDVALRAQPSTVVFHWSTSRRLSAECLGVQWTALGSPFGVFKYDVRLLFDAADPPFWMGTTQHSGTSQIDAMTSSGDFFDALPEYWQFASSSWAVLQCVTGGTSGGSATAYYYKAHN